MLQAVSIKVLQGPALEWGAPVRSASNTGTAPSMSIETELPLLPRIAVANVGALEVRKRAAMAPAASFPIRLAASERM
jgi:hypothetical protein